MFQQRHRLIPSQRPTEQADEHGHRDHTAAIPADHDGLGYR